MCQTTSIQTWRCLLREGEACRGLMVCGDALATHGHLNPGGLKRPCWGTNEEEEEEEEEEEDENGGCHSGKGMVYKMPVCSSLIKKKPH